MRVDRAVPLASLGTSRPAKTPARNPFSPPPPLVHSALARLLPYVEQDNVGRLIDFSTPPIYFGGATPPSQGAAHVQVSDDPEMTEHSVATTATRAHAELRTLRTKTYALCWITKYAIAVSQLIC